MKQLLTHDNGNNSFVKKKLQLLGRIRQGLRNKRTNALSTGTLHDAAVTPEHVSAFNKIFISLKLKQQIPVVEKPRHGRVL